MTLSGVGCLADSGKSLFNSNILLWRYTAYSLLLDSSNKNTKMLPVLASVRNNAY